MGAFDNFGKATRGFQSNPMKEGAYVVRIDECAFFPGRMGDIWKNTLTVLAVDRAGEDGHSVGETINTFFTCKAGTEGRDMFQRKLKAFLAGVLDCEDEAIGKEEAEQASSEESPMVGLVTKVTMRLQASKSSVDDDGNPVKYPVYSWEPSYDGDAVEALLGEEGMEKFFPNGFGN